MGIFPRKCDACGGSFIPSYEHIHCLDMELRYKDLELQRREYSKLLGNIVEAYRKGDCVKEINVAAYHLGYSVSSTEFRWLDEEIERLKIKYPQG